MHQNLIIEFTLYLKLSPSNIFFKSNERWLYGPCYFKLLFNYDSFKIYAFISKLFEEPISEQI